MEEQNVLGYLTDLDVEILKKYEKKKDVVIDIKDLEVEQ